MSSDLFDYLMKDREAELRGTYEEQLRQQQEQLRQQQEQFQQELQHILEETLMVRFPTAPVALLRDIRQVTQASELHRLIVAVQQAPDLAAVERLLHEAAAQAGEP